MSGEFDQLEFDIGDPYERERAIRHFSWERAGRRLLNVYRTAMTLHH